MLRNGISISLPFEWIKRLFHPSPSPVPALASVPDNERAVLRDDKEGGRVMSIFPAISRRVDRVFIHCSASDNPAHDDVSVIRSWHVHGNGWADVGYHYFIKKDGTIQAGRPIDKIPAAQAPHNRYTIAICLHGLKKEKFTTEQFSSLRALCNSINNTLDVTFHGHCEVSDKLCPVFDYKTVLGLAGNGRMARD